MLNGIWIGLLLISIATGFFKALTGDQEIIGVLLRSLFDSSRQAFEIALGLTGTLAFWLGMLRIGERSGIVDALTRGLTPLFRRLMPGVPEGHPALGAIVMNLSANMLGLDNAATPLGIRAMQELQRLNRDSYIASDAQILFFVLNASSVTLLPLTILTYRAQLGAEQPADVFLPILLATFCSTAAGLLSVALIQGLRLRDPVVLGYFAVILAVVGGIVWSVTGLDSDAMQQRSTVISGSAILLLLSAFLITAAWKRIDVYGTFIEGARDGFTTAIGIVPFLVAMLVAVGLLRASGVLGWIGDGLRVSFDALGVDTAFIDALPTALIKPFSGSGARAMMLETMAQFGVDSFPARVAAIIQGSTETTFYVLAVYFGAVGIRRVRHAVACALLADFVGVVAAIVIAYRFFG